MRKDKKWLKEKADRLFFDNSISNNPYLVAKREAITEISNLIDQLEEPDITEEQAWNKIELENSYHLAPAHTEVYKEAIQNGVKPECFNKPEKPVIPQFVADWIEENKGYGFLRAYELLYEEIKEYKADEQLVYYLQQSRSNQESFARAWLDGYEVEKEQKYILSINITDKASKTDYETFLNKRGIFHSMENDSFNSEEFNWTEEEIRGLTKGDILFEHFATKVEELEE